MDINVNNYESFLLSYIDGELSAAEKTVLLQFLDQHPQYKEELQLLQETKLQPEENIHYPNRAILYRKEKRSLYFRLWKPAAAAAVLVLLLAGWLAYHDSQKTGKQNIAATEKEIISNPAASPAANSIAQKIKPDNIDSNNKADIIANNKNKIAANARKHKSSHAVIAITENKKISPLANQPDTATLIAMNKIKADKDVTLAPLASLDNQFTKINKETKSIAVNADNQEKKFAMQMQEIQQEKNIVMAGDEKNNAEKKKRVVVTISGASSNPIMGMVGGLTHLLAKANDYKITSVGLHR